MLMKGRFTHNIDQKGRVFINPKLREYIGSSFVVTNGLDNCLWAFQTSDWEKIEAELISLPKSARAIQEFMFSGAVDVEVDKQGRILIPTELREWAGLTKEVCVLGVGNRMEIWDAKRCKDVISKISSADIEALMDKAEF